MLRVVFLDIDGVLTSARAHYAMARGVSKNDVWHHFDPVVIAFFNRLSEDFKDELKFVMSSSWRRHYEFRDLRTMFSQQGWLGEWHSNWKTPSLNGPRGLEIQAWCLEHKPDRFVIIDDNSDLLPEQFPYFVQTDAESGMNRLEHFIKTRQCLTLKTSFNNEVD